MEKIPASRVLSSAEQEAAARAAFIKMPSRKWRFVRFIDILLKACTYFLPTPPLNDGGKKDPARILVIEYWNLGDLAILMPFLRSLRESFPQAHISLMVKDGLTSFLQGQGLVDQFIPVRIPWAQHFNRLKKYNPFSFDWISVFAIFIQLRKMKFDWAFSGRMDLRDNFFLWLSGSRRRIGYGVGGGGFLLTDRVMPELSRPHRADVWLHLLETVGAKLTVEHVTFRLSDSEVAKADEFLSSRGIPSDRLLIGIHPGARIVTRRWGNERFAEVARDLQLQTNASFLWFSDPDDPSPPPPIANCFNVSTDFRTFLAVLSRCRLLLCNDSGPMHFANLMSVPVVAIFGSTNPVWFGPRGPQDRIVIRPEFWCRPCFDYCIFDQPYCLRTISPDQVLSSTFTALEQLQPARQKFDRGHRDPVSGVTKSWV